MPTAVISFTNGHLVLCFCGHVFLSAFNVCYMKSCNIQSLSYGAGMPSISNVQAAIKILELPFHVSITEILPVWGIA